DYFSPPGSAHLFGVMSMIRRLSSFMKVVAIAATWLTTVALCAHSAHAALAAYEGFNYTAGTKILDSNNDGTYDDGLNGGTGWAGAWDNNQGVATTLTGPDFSYIQAGSLGYTDSSGNVLTTSGGKLINTGKDPNSADISQAGTYTSQPGRTLAARREGDAV